jgi:hypothetical protein
MMWVGHTARMGDRATDEKIILKIMKGTGSEDVGQINLVHDRDRWSAVVNTAMHRLNVSCQWLRQGRQGGHQWTLPQLSSVHICLHFGLDNSLLPYARTAH